jgi:hypothetical protein
MKDGLGATDISQASPATQAQIKALIEGRMAFPTGQAIRTPYWQNMLTMVAQQDPNFDAVNYNARAKTRSDFTSGKSAENIKALNTAISHIADLNDAMSSLNNTDYSWYNEAANYVGDKSGNAKLQNKLAKVETTAKGVAGEMAKVFRSTGMSEKEISDWKNALKSNITPEGQKGTIEAAMAMLNGRLEAIADQYNKGMGTTAQPLEMLTPVAQKKFKRLSGISEEQATEKLTPNTIEIAPEVKSAVEWVRDPETGKLRRK